MTAFACMPVCTFFLALGIVGVMMVILGAGGSGTSTKEVTAPEADTPSPRPPYWVFPVVLVVAAVVLFVASFFTEG